MNKKFINNCLKNFKKSKILCIGDIMLDEFIYGKVERISPEAPVPILLQEEKVSQLGGAANVARNIASMGYSVGLLSVIGTDLASDEIMNLLKIEKNINPVLIKIKGHLVARKTRYVNKVNQLLRVDQEKVNFMNKLIERKILQKLKKTLSKYNTVIISDYKKGMLNKKIIKEIINTCNKNNIKTLVDPKDKDFSLYSGTQIITPNQNELSKTIQIELNSISKIVNQTRKLINKNNFKYVLVTRSEKGMLLISKNKYENFPTMARDVYDVSGAGDTVVSFFALGLGSDLNIRDTVKIANLAAGIVVGKKGTAVINRRELLALQ